MSINRIAVQGKILDVKEGQAKNGNPYLFFTLKHENQSSDGRTFVFFVSCQVWGEQVEKLKSFIVTNEERVIEGCLRVSTRSTEWGDQEELWSITVLRVKPVSTVLNSRGGNNTSVDSKGVFTSAYVTQEPVPHRVSVVERRNHSKSEPVDVEIVDDAEDEIPF